MSSLFGSDDSAQRAQERANERTLQLQAQLAGQAREDAFNLFPQAQEERRRSFQQALGLLQGALPQQTGTFQQGNVAAQNQILAGLPQIQNAILGRPVDLSALQATQVPIDLSFAEQQLPDVSRETMPNNNNIMSLLQQRGIRL